MEEKEEWNEIEVPNAEQNIEYEVEESDNTATETDSKKQEVVESPKEDDPEELDGIKTKGAEKRIRQLVRQRKERDEQINALIQKNEVLVKNLSQKDYEADEMSKVTLDASEKQLTDKIELARSVYLEAFEEGDKEKVLKAQEMLNEAQTDLKAVSSAKANYERIQKKPVEQGQPSQVQKPVHASDPRAEEWASQNEWFGKDNVMTAAALAIDAELKGEGYDPNDKNFYQEVDNRIKKAFPQKFGEAEERRQENTSAPAQVVSGSSRSSPNSSRKVKLSKEDVRLAQKWGIPLEQYAAEKLKVTKADGEYTNIN